MAVRKYLARDFNFGVSPDDGVTYLTISGISSWSFTIDSNSEDTSTFDNAGWGSSMYTQHQGSITLEGFELVDSITGVKDGGQAEVEKGYTKLGYLAYKRFRVAQTSAAGEIGHFTFLGQASAQEKGGGTTDVQAWGTEIMFEGAPLGSGTFAYLSS